MAQCQGVTKKGERCKRDAPEGERFCAIHVDQEVRPREPVAADMEWDREAIMAAALGFALIGAILFFRIRR